jgi:hypothetical protein
MFLLINFYSILDCQGILADLVEIHERLKNNATFGHYVVGGHDQPRHFHVRTRKRKKRNKINKRKKTRLQIMRYNEI